MFSETETLQKENFSEHLTTDNTVIQKAVKDKETQHWSSTIKIQKDKK